MIRKKIWPAKKGTLNSTLKKVNDREKWFVSDAVFNQLYPLPLHKYDGKHWTSLAVAREAAAFLAAEKNVSILDIGSGIGKFCMGAAYYKPDAYYFGVEQRKNLVEYAENARDVLRQDNVSFIEGNFTQLDFTNYDHFYFYNAFYENIEGIEKMDDSVDYSVELYNYYNRYLYKQLESKPDGTRIATYHSLEYEIPPTYHVVGSAFEDILKFWIKV